MEDVSREVVVDAGIAEVWAEVATADRLGEWFGAHVHGDLSPGRTATFLWPDGTERRALVERVEPQRRLIFRWLPYERRDGVTRERPGSRVEIGCEESGDGCIVRVCETRIESAVTPFPEIGFRPLART